LNGLQLSAKIVVLQYVRDGLILFRWRLPFHHYRRLVASRRSVDLSKQEWRAASHNERGCKIRSSHYDSFHVLMLYKTFDQLACVT
jgi:hypothetical protein